jgi:hypothetical protein
VTLLTGNQEIAFNLSAASFGKSEKVPEYLKPRLILSVSITFPDGGELALCNLVN